MRRSSFCIACIAVPLLVWSGAAQADESDNVAKQIRALGSDDPVQMRLAQVNLAHAGKSALKPLNRLTATAGPALHPRIRETAALLLLRNVSLQDLRKHKALFKLCEPAFARARKSASVLLNAKAYDSGERGLAPPGARRPPLSKPMQALNAAAGMHGFAVPVALELCESKSPASRLYGARLLVRLAAAGQLPTLERLSKDPARINIFRGDVTERTTIGKEVSSWIKTNSVFRNERKPDPKYGVCFEAENYVTWLVRVHSKHPSGADLVNQLRQQAKTIQATSWDDYWRRAKPLLAKFLSARMK